VINGDKEAVDAILDHPTCRRRLRRLDADRQYIYARGSAQGKRVQCFGGAKNHMIVMPDADMDQAVDALIGAGYGSPASAAWRCPWRCRSARPLPRRSSKSSFRAWKPEDRPFDVDRSPRSGRW
jgi:hypothetical protein